MCTAGYAERCASAQNIICTCACGGFCHGEQKVSGWCCWSTDKEESREKDKEKDEEDEAEED